MKIIKDSDGNVLGIFKSDQLEDAYKRIVAVDDSVFKRDKPEDWFDFLGQIRDSAKYSVVHTEFDEDAYMDLICDPKFEMISGSPIISDEAWVKLEDEDNPSVAIFDLVSNVEDAEAFIDFGLPCLAEHDQAVKLFNMINKHGF